MCDYEGSVDWILAKKELEVSQKKFEDTLKWREMAYQSLKDRIKELENENEVLKELVEGRRA